MSNFRVVKDGLTRAQAQATEDRYKQRGYEGHHGGKQKKAVFILSINFKNGQSSD